MINNGFRVTSRCAGDSGGDIDGGNKRVWCHLPAALPVSSKSFSDKNSI